MAQNKCTLVFASVALAAASTLCGGGTSAAGASAAKAAVARVVSASSMAPADAERRPGIGAIQQRGAALPPLSAAVVEALKAQPETQTKGRLQIGVGRSLAPISVNARTAPAAQWTIMTNGWRAWSIAVGSTGALGLRVHLESVTLPAGACLLVFDPAEPTRAATAITARTLAGKRDVWTETVFSDQAVVQCQVPPDTKSREVSFNVTEVSHLYTLPNSGIQRGIAETCENDVSCYPAYAQSASGVALMSYVDGGNTYTCTGCLLASTDTNSVANYFLTAHHCIGDQGLASTIELFWLYQTTNCNGTPPALTSVPSTSGGAALLATSVNNDFTFLRLNQAAPAGATALGWSTTAPGTNETLAIIHHPAGDYKRISFGFYFGSDADFWAVEWTNGVTEGGSSGGPLLNGNQQVIGQLNGGFEGPGSDCSRPSDPDQFGRFDLTYPAIQKWIDPSGGTTNPVTNVVTFVRGTYNGLFFDGGIGIAQSSSGAFTITTTTTGRFSGRLQIGSTSYSMSGQFDNTGAAQITVGGRNSSPLTVQLQIGPADNSQISGSVSSSSFDAELTGELAVFDGRTSVAPEAGRYTIIIAGGGDPTTAPGGNGYATVTVSPAGRIAMSGMLADGTRISQSATVSQGSQWPLYVPLYGGQGSVFSWINFSGGGALSGALNWIKPGMMNARYYPNGFTLATTVSGSAYARSVSGGTILSLSSATVTLSAANPSENFSNQIMLNPNDRVANLSSNRLILSFSAGTGTFSGRVQNPANAEWISFAGAVLQNQNIAAGYFLDPNSSQSGQVQIGP
jgi:lysyl endopeptidase